MAARGAQSRLLRKRGGKDGLRVTFIELFFDLVFVFAVTQLSHSLLAHMDVMGAVQAGLLFVAVWWVWVNTSWCTNWLVHQLARPRAHAGSADVDGSYVARALPVDLDPRRLW